MLVTRAILASRRCSRFRRMVWRAATQRAWSSNWNRAESVGRLCLPPPRPCTVTNRQQLSAGSGLMSTSWGGKGGVATRSHPPTSVYLQEADEVHDAPAKPAPIRSDQQELCLRDNLEVLLHPGGGGRGLKSEKRGSAGSTNLSPEMTLQSTISQLSGEGGSHTHRLAPPTTWPRPLAH